LGLILDFCHVVSCLFYGVEICAASLKYICRARQVYSSRPSDILAESGVGFTVFPKSVSETSV
ncbi:MAG: hypothetical protein IJ588_10550, partial [Prevotella sp.]|nr:hypothetical protein [Prevotella sp.]